MNTAILPGWVCMLAILLFSGNVCTQDISIPKGITDDFAFISAGEVTIDDSTHACSAFYMARYELSNARYNNFLKSLADSGEQIILAKAERKSEAWKGYVKQDASYTKLYGSHESYDNFPVVNISQEAAELYCEWLEKELKSQHGDAFDIEVRLPGRVEWVRASRPKNMDDAYTWGGSFLISNTGDNMCNFMRLGAEHIYWDKSAQKYMVKEDLPVSKYSRRIKEMSTGIQAVDAYYANNFGLFNMNGNAAELCAEGLACGGSWHDTGYDVRCDSAVKFESPNPTIGFRPVLLITARK